MKIALTGSGAPTVRSCVKCVKDCHEDAVTLRAELIELVETVASKDNRITDLTSELQDVKNALFKAAHKTDEARTEIERLKATIDTLKIKLEPKGVKEYFEHQTIKNLSTKQINQILTDFKNKFDRKDKLIEQMREALQMVRATSKSFLPGLTWQAVIAALAAERGE